MPPLSLILRADATPSIGAGHAMRLLTLGSAWLDREEGPVRFWGRDDIPFVRMRITQSGIGRAGSRPHMDGGVLVVDSYDPAVRARCAGEEDAGLRVLVDDLGGSVPEGYSLVWNPNAYGSPDLYEDFEGPVIGGEDVIPIREVGTWHAGHSGESRGVGVLLGGGAPPTALVGALADVAHREGFPMAGAGAWVPDGWESVDPEDPWARLLDRDVVVTAAGSTVWEAAAAGVPVVVVRTAENQSGVATWARARGGTVVDAVGRGQSELYAELRRAIPSAAPLPALSSGVDRLIQAIRSEAG